MKRYVVISLLALLAACDAWRAREHGPCAPSDLAKLEASYVAEAIAACRAEGAKTPETCEAFPGIRDKYRAKRAEYVECAK